MNAAERRYKIEEKKLFNKDIFVIYQITKMCYTSASFGFSPLVFIQIHMSALMT